MKKKEKKKTYEKKKRKEVFPQAQFGGYAVRKSLSDVQIPATLFASCVILTRCLNSPHSVAPYLNGNANEYLPQKVQKMC